MCHAYLDCLINVSSLFHQWERALSRHDALAADEQK